MTKDKSEVALYISSNGGNTFGDPYYEVTADFVKIEENGEIRNGIGEPYDGITFKIHHYILRESHHAGSYTKMLFTKYEPELHDIEPTFKLMKKIQAGIDKARDIEGVAVDFAEYMLRVSRIMKVKTWIFRTGDERSSSYRDREHVRLSDGIKVEKLRHMLNDEDWKAKVEELL